MGSVQVVRGDEIPVGPVTQGMTRKVAEAGENVTLAEVRSAAQAASGWHHHGEHTTCVYVVRGQLRLEWGSGGRESADLAGGDFYVMPPETIHREANPGSEDHVLAGFYVGSGPVVVNVDGPEPG